MLILDVSGIYFVVLQFTVKWYFKFHNSFFIDVIIYMKMTFSH